ncbi:hypothetical protein BJF92_09265 [Rhizobium rhizosphaerae]|uniref:Uncharacterized protein n=1 Tax=Xaviernesmea rhizosphaerae TaxID=1672749 RepID=A0A1Q9AKK8_9HYPH|nr:hypothetical protein [Xaviernesmea rhizosphaerae]OLP55808.1 hypothetical protein BJF92_09265 [Xaviernesmea rhizosphaerae]
MADSDSSRTLPSVTRRTLLQMATTTLAARVTAMQPARDREDASACKQDPALVLWRDWQAANRKARALGRWQARLESRLVDAVGFPQIELSLGGRTKPMIVSTKTEIEHWLGGEPESAIRRQRAISELAARQKAWTEMDQRLEYSRAQNAEREALEDEEDLLETFWMTRARTCAGAAGKLHAMLTTGEPREGSEEFPWPQIRIVLEDLLHIAD